MEALKKETLLTKKRIEGKKLKVYIGEMSIKSCLIRFTAHIGTETAH